VTRGKEGQDVDHPSSLSRGGGLLHVVRKRKAGGNQKLGNGREKDFQAFGERSEEKMKESRMPSENTLTGRLIWIWKGGVNTIRQRGDGRRKRRSEQFCLLKTFVPQ